MLYFYRKGFRAGVVVIEESVKAKDEKGETLKSKDGKDVFKINRYEFAAYDQRKGHVFEDEKQILSKYPKWFYKSEKACKTAYRKNLENARLIREISDNGMKDEHG